MLNLEETVNREWLKARFHVLELAAILDRLETAAGRPNAASPEDPRIAVLRRALQELPITGQTQSRTERILRMYSELAPATR